MKHVICISLLTAILGLAFGCKEPPRSAATAPAPSPKVELTLSAQEVSGLESIRGDYEGIRVLLANDETEGLAALASAMVTRSSTLAAQSSGALRPRLEQISRRAKDLEKASSQSIKAARFAFGELSREIVTVLASSAPLQAKLRVFECGMAEGYQKWVQPGEALENPYMGQAMLGCGSKTAWEP